MVKTVRVITPGEPRQKADGDQLAQRGGGQLFVAGATLLPLTLPPAIPNFPCTTAGCGHINACAMSHESLRETISG